MEATQSYLELELRVQEPIEISDFVRAFAALGEQYQRYLQRVGYAHVPSARIYVKRVREGSIIAELIPILMPIISSMDAVVVVDGFARMVRGEIRTSGGSFPISKQAAERMQRLKES